MKDRLERLTADNWMTSDEKSRRVMSEVAKIGKYFEGHIEKLL